jgi:uncharacterized protein with GYD domain
MPTYISLCRWTQQGSEKIKESPSRLDAAKKAFEPLGVKLRDFYMTTGRYDMVMVCDAPDEMAMAKAMLSVSAKGSIKTETVRAFNEEEYRKVIAALP